MGDGGEDGGSTIITTTFTSDAKLIMRSYRSSHRGAYLFRWVATLALIAVGLGTGSYVTAGLGLVVFA